MAGNGGLMKMSWETVWMGARPVLIAVLLAILLLRMFEDRLIFFPNVHAWNDWDTRSQGLETEDVFFVTEDNVRIHGWWIAAPVAPAESEEPVPTILYLHGNAANLTNRIDNLKFLRDLPANLFAIDYRYYGKSEGPFPNEEGVYHDARAAYDYLVKERGVDPARLIVLGQSLGTAIAVHLATEREVAGLILESGLPSAPRVAQLNIPLPGVRFIMRSRFDSAAKLPGIHKPVLVAHCVDDPILSLQLGEELFAAANEPKTLVTYDSACHEPLYDVAYEEYADRLRELIAQAIPPAAGPPGETGSP